MIQTLVQITLLCSVTWLACCVLDNKGAAWQQRLVGVCLLLCLAVPLMKWVPLEINQIQAWQAPMASLSDDTPGVEKILPIESAKKVTKVLLAIKPGTKTDWSEVFLWLWLIGSVLVLCLRIRGFLQLWRIKRLAQYFSQHDSLTVYISPQAEVPMLCAIGKASIILPQGMSDWSKSQLRHVFDHERCHHLRKDHWYLLLAALLSVVYWFHPMIYWLTRRLKQQMELACDQQLLAGGTDPIGYAETLLACVHPANNNHVITMATQPNQISQRVEAVIRIQRSGISRRRKIMVYLLSGVLLVGCVDFQVQSWVESEEMVALVGHDLPSIRTQYPDRGGVLLSAFYDGKDVGETQVRLKLSDGQSNSWLTLGPLQKFNQYIHTWHFQLKNRAQFTGEYEIIGVEPDGVVDGVAIGLIGTNLNGQFSILKSKSEQLGNIPNIMCSWPLGLPDEELIRSLPQLSQDNPDSVRRLLCGAQLVKNGVHALN